MGGEASHEGSFRCLSEPYGGEGGVDPGFKEGRVGFWIKKYPAVQMSNLQKRGGRMRGSRRKRKGRKKGEKKEKF